MWHDDREILQYQTQRGSQPVVRRFPWGLLSVTLGICAAVGVPAFDGFARVPASGQGPILGAGIIAAVLAIISGSIAGFVRGQRMRGIIGVCFGVVALVFLPSLTTA